MFLCDSAGDNTWILQVLSHEDQLTDAVQAVFTVEDDLIAYDPDLPGPATYDCTDMASFLFSCANGGSYQYAVPMPKPGIFLADTKTVDPDNADVIAFVTAFLVHAVNADGFALSEFVKGWRWKLNTRD